MNISDQLHTNRKSILRYTVIWVLVFTILALPFGLQIAAALVGPLIVPVHVNFYLIDRYLKKENYLKYGLFVLLIVVVFGFVAQGISSSMQVLSEIIHINPLKLATSPEEVIHIVQRPTLNFVFNPLLAIILTTLFRHFKREAGNSNTGFENTKVQAELDFLKSQVNPHFLFNTLNNLFSIASTNNDDEAADGIGRLSHLMRYILHDAKVDKVRLQKEIELIEDFIELQKLRLSDEDFKDVNFELEGNIEGIQVPPMLLIPFVENAFKHGVSVHGDFYIKINLKVEEGQLYFNVENSINKLKGKPDDNSSGIGLVNVNRRLNLIFPDQHKLEIHNLQEKHVVSLMFPY